MQRRSSQVATLHNFTQRNARTASFIDELEIEKTSTYALRTQQNKDTSTLALTRFHSLFNLFCLTAMSVYWLPLSTVHLGLCLVLKPITSFLRACFLFQSNCRIVTKSLLLF